MEKLTLKKLITPKPATRVEYVMTIFYLFSFLIIVFVPYLVFGLDTLKTLQTYILILGLLSLTIGYKVGRNHDRIELWLSNKFSKKNDAIKQIIS
jgi:hypothetical protein